jgi:hypothetical protein
MMPEDGSILVVATYNPVVAFEQVNVASPLKTRGVVPELLWASKPHESLVCHSDVRWK